MNLDTFFEKFELLADASNALAKMRGLILHLAGRGKLVPQDLHDDQVELSFPTLTTFAEKIDNDTFPSHWLRVPSGKLGEWRGGGTPSKAHTDYWDGPE